LTNGEIAEYFKRKGWEIDSAKVSGWAYSWPDVAGMPLEQDSTNGEWRRLVFKRCGYKDDQGKEQCLYPVILLRKNGDEWKISNASRLAAYRYNDDGSEIKLSDLRFHKMFRLPPSFIDLKPKEGPSQIEAHPINPGDTVSNK
jgi:hypothetical protein